MASSPQQIVTLVPRGGTPITIADARGRPYPTTGIGALVFSRNPLFQGPVTIDGDLIFTGTLNGLVVSFPSRPVTGSVVTMLPTDGEVVVLKAPGSATSVILPPDVAFGHQARVSDGNGDAGTHNISVEAAGGGTINGEAGPLVMAFNWETTLFRSLGDNAWSIL